MKKLIKMPGKVTKSINKPSARAKLESSLLNKDLTAQTSTHLTDADTVGETTSITQDNNKNCNN